MRRVIVVGYQNKVIDKSGFNYVCGTFERIDGKDTTLADVGKNDLFSCDNPDFIIFLDDGGGTKVRVAGDVFEAHAVAPGQLVRED